MRGITFNYRAPVTEVEPTRMDVVCFVGFVSKNSGISLPESLKQWWKETGYQINDDIVNLPVPVESWDSFKSIFNPGRLSHQAQIHGTGIPADLSIPSADAHLHFIVDRLEYDLEITTAGGNISCTSLVDQLNDHFRLSCDGLIEAKLLEGSVSSHIVLKRTNLQIPGELTVYPNKSLGFFKTMQDDDSLQDNYLAAAVRSFFREGGQKCYVVSTGNPLPCYSGEGDRTIQVYRLFYGDSADFIPENQVNLKITSLSDCYLPAISGNSPNSEKHGIACLPDLSDAAYLCLPDLVEFFTADITPMKEVPEQEKPETFVQCSTEETYKPWYYAEQFKAPRNSFTEYRIWKRFIDLALSFIETSAPDYQLIASLPLPDTAAGNNFEDFVVTDLFPDRSENDLFYRRLQLAFPWLKTDMSAGLPESIEPPEGALAGLLAGSALFKGAYRSIAEQQVHQCYDLFPERIDAYNPRGSAETSFYNRVSFFGFEPTGIFLQSDVTASRSISHRYAVVRRIMVLIHKSARILGLNTVFETNGQRTWKLITDTMTALLMKIYNNKGLGGASPKDAFSVECGHSTMTRQDIDNGRFIVNISLQPALPIERITVNMMIDKNRKIITG